MHNISRQELACVEDVTTRREDFLPPAFFVDGGRAASQT